MNPVDGSPIDYAYFLGKPIKVLQYRLFRHDERYRSKQAVEIEMALRPELARLDGRVRDLEMSLYRLRERLAKV